MLFRSADAVDRFIGNRPDEFVISRPFTQDETEDQIQTLMQNVGGTEDHNRNFVLRNQGRYSVNVRAIRSFTSWLRKCGGFKIG